MEKSIKIKNIYLIALVFLYNLFALTRIKYMGGLTIEGIKEKNIAIIYAIVLILILITKLISRDKNDNVLNKHNNVIFLLLFAYLGICMLGFLKVSSTQQFIYAIVSFILPLMFFFTINENTARIIDKILKFIIIFNIIYAILTIVSSLNYSAMMSFLNNNLVKQYTKQYRANMMLGSSITVSYYFNITLPLCFFFFYNSKTKLWKRIGLIATILNITVTLILLSRVSALTTCIIVFFFLLLKNKKKDFLKKLVFFILIIILGIQLINFFDLDRLVKGFSDNSTSERMSSMKLAYEIFKDNPIIGSGTGNYFTRVYEERVITYEGCTGLVDPHNVYLLILSETGILGFLLLSGIFVYIYFLICKIKNDEYRKVAKITMIAFLITQVGGSHLFTSMELSMIFWTYLAIFRLGIVKEKIEI